MEDKEKLTDVEVEAASGGVYIPPAICPYCHYANAVAPNVHTIRCGGCGRILTVQVNFG